MILRVVHAGPRGGWVWLAGLSSQQLSRSMLVLVGSCLRDYIVTIITHREAILKAIHAWVGWVWLVRLGTLIPLLAQCVGVYIFVVGPPHLRVHSRSECSQAFPVFHRSSASVYYKKKLKNENGRGLGTRLETRDKLPI